MAPRHQVPMPPLTAIVRSVPSRESNSETVEATDADDSRWLMHFAIIATIVGLIAIAFIAVFLKF